MVKKPHLEIERKFVLKKLPTKFRDKCQKHLSIMQYYFLIDGVWNRYRRVQELDTYTGELKKLKFVHTIKRKISAGIQEETECTVKEKDFIKIRDNKNASSQRKIIKKDRYILKYKKLKFEVDVYKDIHLITLEVELPDLKCEIEFPPELDNAIIADVTHVKGFSNLSMAETIL